MALLIGVVSCGVIVLAAGVFVARARGARSARARSPPAQHALHALHALRAREHDSEMAWDDSALTITVNPMEEVRIIYTAPITQWLFLHFLLC